jgi:hypothetical protein
LKLFGPEQERVVVPLYRDGASEVPRMLIASRGQERES